MPRALLSVFDKTGVVDFARALHDLGWELLSSGGTAGREESHLHDVTITHEAPNYHSS